MVNDKSDLPSSKTVGTTEGNVKLEASGRKARQAGAGSLQPLCSDGALRIIINKALFSKLLSKINHPDGCKGRPSHQSE